jgi:hypothetical protein
VTLTAFGRRRALVTIEPRHIGPIHAEPDLPLLGTFDFGYEAVVTSRLLDDPETFWRHMTTWRH